MSLVRQQLLKAGVKNLREFGYPDCDTTSILTDPIYKAFFASMLKDNKGHGAHIDIQIDKLLGQIEQPPTTGEKR